MGLILDSSPLIAYEKAKVRSDGLPGDAQGANSHCGHHCFRTSSWNSSRAPDARLSQKRADHVEWILSTFETIPFALDEARHHSRIWAQLASSGKMIGYHDLLIAATALSLGYALATLNFDEFAACRV